MLLPKSELAAVPVDSVFLTGSVCDFGTEINNLTIRGCSTQEETRVALSPCRPSGNAELQPLEIVLVPENHILCLKYLGIARDDLTPEQQHERCLSFRFCCCIAGSVGNAHCCIRERNLAFLSTVN
jgi:hypothetical protein